VRLDHLLSKGATLHLFGLSNSFGGPTFKTLF
jgi:hypothetical protein